MKKRYYCKRLNETLNFDALKVFYCCATRTGPSIDIPKPDKIKDIITKQIRFHLENAHRYFLYLSCCVYKVLL